MLAKLLDLLPLFLIVVYIGGFLGVEMMMSDMEIRIPHVLALFIPALSVMSAFIILVADKPAKEKIRVFLKYVMCDGKLILNLYMWADIYTDVKKIVKQNRANNRKKPRKRSAPQKTFSFRSATEEYISNYTGAVN